MNKTANQYLLKRNSFLQKMLLSIICLLCIPLLVMQVFGLVRASKVIESNNTAQYTAMLQSFAGAFKNEIDSLAQSASHISADKDVEAMLDGNVDEHTINAAASVLTYYESAHGLIDGAGIYNKTTDTALYHKSLKDVSYFCDLFYAGNSAGREKLEQFLEHTQVTACFATGSFEGCLNETLIVAVPVSGDAVAFFTIDMTALEAWSALFVPAGSGIMIAANGNEYLLLGEKDTAQESGFRRFLSDPEQTSYVTGAYVYYKYHGDNSRFVTAIPKETAQMGLMRYVSQMKLILAVTVILALVLVIITIYINYMPLFRLVKRHTKPDPDDQKMSELELIESHFLARDKQIDDQQRALSAFAVGDLLCGGSVSPEELSRYFPKALYSSFAVAVTEHALTPEQAGQIEESVECALGGKLIITTIPNRPETIFVRAADTAIELHALRDSLEHYLETVISEPSSIHMGLDISELDQILLSYYEALFADKLTDFLWDDEEGEKASELIQSFEKLVLAGKQVKALQFLDELEENEAALRTSLKQLYFYKIIHTYLSALQRSGVKLNSEELNQLLSFKSSEQMFSNLRRSIVSLPTKREALSISHQERQERLLAYVDKNYLDNMICLTSVADYMQTSIYTISRLFKEITGQGFKEYIMNKRLQKACSMLEASSLAVSEIATVCGFEDANYFTIVFKRKYGMPPSKYREEIASKGIQDEIPSK